MLHEVNDLSKGNEGGVGGSGGKVLVEKRVKLFLKILPPFLTKMQPQQSKTYIYFSLCVSDYPH